MDGVNSVTVALNGGTRQYSASFQTDTQYEHGWQSVLKAAYGRAEIRCCCRGNGPKRLAVKYYESADRFALARFALSGGQHALDCQYYSPGAADSGANGRTTGVVEDLGDGSVKIRLDIGMAEKPETTVLPAPGGTPEHVKPSVRQSSMKLLGLLHYLWEESKLAQWKPGFTGKRKAPVAYWWIRCAAESVWVGQVRLVDQLLLPAYEAKSREAQRNAQLVEASALTKRRMVLIAPLAACTPEQLAAMGKQLKIAGFHGMPMAFMQPDLWEITQRRFKAAVAAWMTGHPTIVIAQLELKQRKTGIVALVVDMALMGVTAEYIPVESSYERIVASALVKQARAFTKPLRYDAERDLVHPDFVLLDTEAEVPLEVFGRDDPDYLKRKEEKRAYYDARYGVGGWWSWDAGADTSQEQIPPFPPARRAVRKA